MVAGHEAAGADNGSKTTPFQYRACILFSLLLDATRHFPVLSASTIQVGA